MIPGEPLILFVTLVTFKKCQIDSNLGSEGGYMILHVQRTFSFSFVKIGVRVLVYPSQTYEDVVLTSFTPLHSTYQQTIL